MTPPIEPVLAFAAIASVGYVLAWWLWWDAIVDDGIELQYAER